MADHSVAPDASGQPVEYREIPEFPGYRVGSDGSVWTCWKRQYQKGRIGYEPILSEDWNCMKPTKHRKGYLKVVLRREGRSINCLVHRLVLEAFVGPCPEGMEAAHNNGVRTDNRLENLRWATPKDNWGDRVKHGTDIRGEQHQSHKLTDAVALQVLKDWANGETQTSIARRLDVSVSLVNYIIRGKTWKHLPRPSESENSKPR